MPHMKQVTFSQATRSFTAYSTLLQTILSEKNIFQTFLWFAQISASLEIPGLSPGHDTLSMYLYFSSSYILYLYVCFSILQLLSVLVGYGSNIICEKYHAKSIDKYNYFGYLIGDGKRNKSLQYTWTLNGWKGVGKRKKIELKADTREIFFNGAAATETYNNWKDKKKKNDTCIQKPDYPICWYLKDK